MQRSILSGSEAAVCKGIEIPYYMQIFTKYFKSVNPINLPVNLKLISNLT